MEFVPFQPAKEKKQEREQIKTRVLNGLQKGSSAKFAFIEKHRLVELISDQEDKTTNYYFDQKSKMVLEINNKGPVVFMKTSPELTKYLVKLNDVY